MRGGQRRAAGDAIGCGGIRLSDSRRAAGSAAQAARGALHAIGLLFKPGDIIEIRALAVGRTPNHRGVTYSGYFNLESEEAIRKAVSNLDGRAEGIYVTLNHFDAALLARSNNRLQASPKWATSDKDIVEWRWIYIDCDPDRPSGISATDQEHKAALARAAEIRAFLSTRGWPEPIYCDSGNGAHLLYLLPVLDVQAASGIVRRCLKALGNRFSDSLVKVDETTANPSRLCKLYGTMTRKGDAMPDRPHRRARIIDEPEKIEPVPVPLLEALAGEGDPSNRCRNERRSNATSSRLQVEEWLAAKGIPIVRGPEAYEGGRRWILASCPFNPEHKQPAVIELRNGALVFSCLHRSCEQRSWRSFRQFYEPGYSEKSPPAGSQTDDADSGEDVPLITDLAQIPSIWTLEMNLDWCVNEMIAKGSVTLICAESGTGKTWVGYYIAGCVAHGMPVIGHPSPASEVLYCDGENPLYVVKQRLFDLGIRENRNLIVWGGWNPWPPPSPNSPIVVDFARKHKGLIIYDSLVEFHPGCEQSSTETRAFMRHFRKLANLGAAVVILHHTGKSETSKLYRGSSDIKAAVDTAYVLTKGPGESETLGRLSLACFKGRLTPGRNFGMEFRKGVGFISSVHVPPEKNIEDTIQEILEASPGLNQMQILRKTTALGLGRDRVMSSLKNGPWVKAKGPNNSTLYSPPLDSSERQS